MLKTISVQGPSLVCLAMVRVLLSIGNILALQVTPKWDRSGIRWTRSESEMRLKWIRKHINWILRDRSGPSVGTKRAELTSKGNRRAIHMKSVLIPRKSKWSRSEVEVKSKWNRSDIGVNMMRNRSHSGLKINWNWRVGHMKSNWFRGEVEANCASEIVLPSHRSELKTKARSKIEWKSRPHWLTLPHCPKPPIRSNLIWMY